MSWKLKSKVPQESSNVWEKSKKNLKNTFSLSRGKNTFKGKKMWN